jgi:hypothetical protein
VIIGRAAMQLQGSAYITEDLDFCYERSPKNFERLTRALKPFHARLRNAPEDLPCQPDAETLKRGVNFTLPTDLGALDFLGEVAGLGGCSELKAAAERMQLFGRDYQVLSLDGLLKAKRAAGRAKDMDAVKNLEVLLDLRKRAGL